MRLDDLANIIWSAYNNGNPKSTSQLISQQKIVQFCKLGYANVMRELYMRYQNKNNDNENYFFSANLFRKKFPLGEPTASGRRRVEFGKYYTIPLPENKDIFNVEGIGSCDTSTIFSTITQVQPAEERFYLTPEFKGLSFFSKRGNGIDAYNFPLCINEVEVEGLWDSDELQVPNDIAFDIVKSVLALLLDTRKLPQNKVDDESNEMLQQIKTKLGDAAPQ